MNKSMKKYVKCGPGGINCRCCFPAPGTWQRRLKFRQAKRRRRQQALRCEELVPAES